MNRRSSLVTLLLVLAGAAAAASEHALTLERGATRTVPIPFELEMGANSDPEVLGATLDLEKKELILEGRQVGDATYTVFERPEGNRERRSLEVHVRVVAAP